MDINSTAMLVDGFLFRDPRDNSPMTRIPLSMIDSVTIEKSGFDAGYGTLQGNVIRLATKEGGRNDYSGSVRFRYDPPAPKHSGISVFDPNSYFLRPYLDNAVCWGGTDNGAWDRYTRREYPSFIGWNQIAEYRIQDDDPNNDFTPAGLQRIFIWTHRKRPITDQPDYSLDVGFGGPVPLLNRSLGNLRFYAGFSRNREMLLYPSTRNDEVNQTAAFRLTSDTSYNSKLYFSLFSGYETALYGNDFPNQRIRTVTQMAEAVDLQFPESVFSNAYFSAGRIAFRTFNLGFMQTLTPGLKYEVRVEHLTRRFEAGPPALRDTTRRYEIINGYYADEAPDGFWPDNKYDDPSGTLHTGYKNCLWRDSTNVSSTSIRLDVSAKPFRWYQVQTGIVWTGHELRWNEKMCRYFYNGGNNQYQLQFVQHNSPRQGAAFINNQLRFSRFQFSLGLRLDCFEPNTDWVYLDPFERSFFISKYNQNKVFRGEHVDFQYAFSPRFAISFPLFSHSTLYFNIGKYAQLPDFKSLFQIQRDFKSDIVDYGNPSLRFLASKTLELGYEQRLWKDHVLRVSCFKSGLTNLVKDVLYIDLTDFFHLQKSNGGPRGNQRIRSVVSKGLRTLVDRFCERFLSERHVLDVGQGQDIS